MPNAPLVTAIICTHNNRDIIDACLDSLDSQTFPLWQCIVVDDASTDGTADYIEEHYPTIKVLRNATNHGPSWGRNHAAGHATTEYLAFLDSDIELDSHWFEETMRVIQSDPRIAIVGGKLFYATRPDCLHAYGGDLSRIGIGWNRHDGAEDVDLDQQEDTLWVSSAACLMKTSVFREVGGFDADYFYGYEDSDLGWRTCLLGHQVVCTPAAHALHRVSETVDRLGDRIVFHFHKNRLRSVLKNYGIGSLVCNLPLYGAYLGVDILLRPQRRAKLRALAWNISHWGETRKMRANTQSQRAVSDRDIAHLFSKSILPRRTLKSRRQKGSVGVNS